MPDDLRGLDAVANLADEPILGLWTSARWRRIVESRIGFTRRIVGVLGGSSVRTLVNASVIGYYGDTGENEVDERSPCGDGFLAETCRGWEAAAVGAADEGSLVRFGRPYLTSLHLVVACVKLRPPFRKNSQFLRRFD